LTLGVENGAARKSLSQFGLPNSIFRQSGDDLLQCMSMKQASALQEVPEGLAALVDATCLWLEASSETRKVLTLGDDDYPSCLLEMEDPPTIFVQFGAARSLA